MYSTLSGIAIDSRLVFPKAFPCIDNMPEPSKSIDRNEMQLRNAYSPIERRVPDGNLTEERLMHS